MTKLILREGDIFDTDAMAIGHGVNTAGFMGAGIAAQFKDRFPFMYEAYRRMCEISILHPGGVYPYTREDGRIVYNIASQDRPGANATYDFLLSGVSRTLSHAEMHGIPVVALPRIGSGIGGLDEAYVEGILFSLARTSPVDIELWTYRSDRLG